MQQSGAWMLAILVFASLAWYEDHHKLEAKVNELKQLTQECSSSIEAANYAISSSNQQIANVQTYEYGEYYQLRSAVDSLAKQNFVPNPCES